MGSGPSLHLSSSKRVRAAENSCCVIRVASEVLSAWPQKSVGTKVKTARHKCAVNVPRNLPNAEKYATYGTLARAGRLG
jgi:hypothetical protein